MAQSAARDRDLVTRAQVFPGEPESVPVARRFVTSLSDGCPVRPDAELPVTGTATNAITRSGQPGGTFLVRVLPRMAARAPRPGHLRSRPSPYVQANGYSLRLSTTYLMSVRDRMRENQGIMRLPDRRGNVCYGNR